MPTPYKKKPHGTPFEKRIPIIHIIGGFTFDVVKMSHWISEVRTELITIHTHVGSLQINGVELIHWIYQAEVLKFQLTQEVISEDSLREIEKRLEQVTWFINHLDTSEITDKIKGLAQSLRDRDDRSKDGAETQHLEEG
jgi:hypothetical protein